MAEKISSTEPSVEYEPKRLLDDGEIVAVVDDSPETARLLTTLLESRQLPVVAAGTAESLFTILNQHKVALVILDLELPSKDGSEILPELAAQCPDLGIIIVTGTDDLQTALTCLRRGADDYLLKPVNGDELHHTIIEVLKKRRLAIDNRLFRRRLQLANLRTQFLHHLILKMNSAYLSALELQRVLQAILIGITSEQGLAFNRAFLALFNKGGTLLRGELAIGPGSHEEAEQIWNGIRDENLDLVELFARNNQDSTQGDTVVNQIVRRLQVPADRVDHPLIHACRSRNSILVSGGRAYVDIPQDLIDTLNVDTFVITPLFSPGGELGVIIADNFVTGKPIDTFDVEALEIFAGQASLAIEHSRLYAEMQIKIDELEMITEELEQSQDLLVASERYTALGHMSAQLVHALRNPITSIGGTARLLHKRSPQEDDRKFLDILTRESAKVESTLSDLFTFVSDTKLDLQEQSLFDLVRRSVMVFYGQMKKFDIGYELTLAEEPVMLELDADKIQQAFMHLIKNSIESMTGGGTLTVSAEINEQTVSVLISDTGAGIVNGDLSRVVDPFYTTKTYGTGMGLTLVEQILKQHRGYFTLTTNPDQGMTARVTLPLD